MKKRVLLSLLLTLFFSATALAEPINWPHSEWGGVRSTAYLLDRWNAGFTNDNIFYHGRWTTVPWNWRIGGNTNPVYGGGAEPSLNPDDAMISVTTTGPFVTIYATGSSDIQLTRVRAYTFSSVWSPISDEVYFSRISVDQDANPIYKEPQTFFRKENKKFKSDFRPYFEVMAIWKLKVERTIKRDNIDDVHTLDQYKVLEVKTTAEKIVDGPWIPFTFHPDGKILYLKKAGIGPADKPYMEGEEDGVWEMNLDTKEIKMTSIDGRFNLREVAWAWDKRGVAYATTDGDVFIHQFSTGKTTKVAHPGFVQSMTFTPDNQFLLYTRLAQYNKEKPSDPDTFFFRVEGVHVQSGEPVVYLKNWFNMKDIRLKGNTQRAVLTTDIQ